MLSTWSIVILAGAIVLGLASLGSGIYCIVRYATTRKIGFLVAGLLLTLFLPGLLIFGALVFWNPIHQVIIPDPQIVYGPPPDFEP